MKAKILPIVALIGAGLSLVILPEAAAPSGFIWLGFALIPCLLLWLQILVGKGSWLGDRWFHRLAEAASLVAMLLVGPQAIMATASFGYGLGVGLAKAERSQSGLPPLPAKPNPFDTANPVGKPLFHLLRGLVLVGLTAELLRRLRLQERRAQNAHAQALRTRLAPHFIFNTLNTLKAQIEKDPTSAAATTDRLAALFRQVIQVSDHPTIPLRQELSFVEAYLAIEKARLGERLRTTIGVPEELEDTPVPPLALQVLVENAVKHGVAPQEAGGTVAIRAVRLGGTLQISVTDSGTGLGSEPGTGTALETLRQRLAKPEDLTLQRTSEGFRACFVWRQP